MMMVIEVEAEAETETESHLPVDPMMDVPGHKMQLFASGPPPKIIHIYLCFAGASIINAFQSE